MTNACEYFELIDYIDSFIFEGQGGPPGPPGPPGEAIFIPHVTSGGWLSWTNTAGLPNPDPINLTGPEGATVRYFADVAINAADNAQIARIPTSGTDSSITEDTVLVSIEYADPKQIPTRPTWTSYAGYLLLVGTCLAGTTANVILATKAN